MKKGWVKYIDTCKLMACQYELLKPWINKYIIIQMYLHELKLLFVVRECGFQQVIDEFQEVQFSVKVWECM